MTVADGYVIADRYCAHLNVGDVRRQWRIVSVRQIPDLTEQHYLWRVYAGFENKVLYVNPVTRKGWYVHDFDLYCVEVEPA